MVVHAPLAARGASVEEKYPWHWLGGTGEVSTIRKWEQGGTPTTEENHQVHLIR